MGGSQIKRSAPERRRIPNSVRFPQLGGNAIFGLERLSISEVETKVVESVMRANLLGIGGHQCLLLLLAFTHPNIIGLCHVTVFDPFWLTLRCSFQQGQEDHRSHQAARKGQNMTRYKMNQDQDESNRSLRLPLGALKKVAVAHLCICFLIPLLCLQVSSQVLDVLLR